MQETQQPAMNLGDGYDPAEWTRFILHCSRCKTTHSATYRKSEYGLWYRVDPAGKKIGLETDRQCQCGRYIVASPVVGRYSPGHRCDPRCLYAKGPDCECQCGGKNHGSGWTAP